MRDGRNDGGELSAHLLRLTHALYRVTDRMPRDEPLRHGMRERAGRIFSVGMIVAHGKDLNGEADDVWIAIEILLGYLTMAPVLGCADPANFLVLEREYRMFAETLAAVGGEHTIKEQGEERAYGQWPELELKSANDKGAQRKETTTGAGAERPPASEPKVNGEVSERQKKIMERLAQEGQAKISDFYTHFNGVSSKTIQRDLQDLTTRNLIKKEGAKRWTTYVLI